MISKELLSEVLNEEVEEINIHELAYKCKKWAYGLGYDIKESKNSLVISKLTSTGHERVLIERYKLHGVKPEDIIEGCQYILEQKATS